MHRSITKITTTVFLSSLIVSTSVHPGMVHALTYSRDIGVNFTFNSSIQVTLSSPDLVISNLAPGTVADSNVIDVNILTNSIAGYTLNATVGNNTYNTRNLVHSDSNATAAFTSVNYATTPTIISNTDLADDTWAYSYSVDDGSTWANYNGLPLYSDETNVALLKESNGPVATNAGDKVKFKIAARAASTQVSGEYNNVINFTAVATPLPKTLEMAFADSGATKLDGFYKMQDMTSEICDAVEVDESQLQLIDSRDNKIYWIAKLADGHCWMTQNLDLDLKTDVAYTHADTDLGWGSDSSTVSWTPINGTLTPNVASGIVTGWSSDAYLPFSADTGNWYFVGTYDNYYARLSDDVNYLTSANRRVEGSKITVYATSRDAQEDYFSNQPLIVNDTHGHIGNYYNFSAAIASNDSSNFIQDVNYFPSSAPQNSICPAGWRLPTMIRSSDTSSGDVTDEFARLNDLYQTELYPSTSFNFESAPLYFMRGGAIGDDGALSNPGGYGSYWSSTVNSASNIFTLILYTYSAQSSNVTTNRGMGLFVRCLAR